MKLKNLTQSEVLNLAKPIWDNLIQGANQKNYGLFSRDFSTHMLQHATQQEITHQWEQDPMLSNLLEQPEFMGYLTNERGIRVLWKQKFNGTADEHLGHLELIEELGVVKVDGAQIL